MQGNESQSDFSQDSGSQCMQNLSKFTYAHNTNVYNQGSSQKMECGQGSGSNSQQNIGAVTQQLESHIFTPAQYEEILKLLNKAPNNETSTPLANTAGSFHWEGEGDW